MAGRVILQRLRLATYAVLFLLLLAFCLIQVQQRILRHRAESLMEDVHKIRLHQSDWNEAQTLMNRWGAWGHYDGSCTAADCRYSITLNDPGWWLMRHDFYQRALFRGYQWLGGKIFSMRVQFIVQDGTIWRTGAGLALDVPPNSIPDDEYGYTLLIRTRARETLRDNHEKGEFRVLGDDEQLARHPNYKAGRPGGCEGCLGLEVTYVPDTDPAEIQRLTTFDFSCLTRLRRCTSLEDIYPAAKERVFYPGIDYGAASRFDNLKALFTDVDVPEIRVPGPPERFHPQPCDIPLWVLGRDTTHAFVVDVLSKESHDRDRGWTEEWTNVRLLEQLKGHVSWKPGTILKVHTYGGEFQYPPLNLAEPLTPGKRLILLLTPEKEFIVLPTGDFEEKDSEPVMRRCGVFEDTPEIRRELQKGAGLNDHLRGPEVDIISFPWN